MSSNVRDVVRARIRDRIRAVGQVDATPGLGSVTLETPSPVKTKAELQDELTAAGVEFSKRATRSDLEALLPGNTTPDLGALVAEDAAEVADSK
jgi:phosphoribosyl-dephospho-CoA transferase